MHRAVLLAPLLLAACASSDAGAQGSRAADLYEAIGFEMNSWGRPIGSWQVRADGTSRHVKRASEAGAPFRDYRLEHREFMVAPGEFARLAQIAAELPRPALADCTLRATDLPYGTLRLSRGGAVEEIYFDTGCQDAPYRAFVARLRAMDELVMGWAEQHPVTRVEEVGDR